MVPRIREASGLALDHGDDATNTGDAMIYSDRQCGVSERELANLKSALAATEAQPTDDEWLRELEIEGLKSQIAEIEADISRYNMLKSGDNPTQSRSPWTTCPAF